MENGLSWLTNADVYNLRHIVVALEYADVTPSRAKLPATLDVLERVISGMELLCPWQMAMATSLMLGHNVLLRGSELHSGLRVRDLGCEINHREVVVSLARSKTHTAAHKSKLQFFVTRVSARLIS